MFNNKTENYLIYRRTSILFSIAGISIIIANSFIGYFVYHSGFSELLTNCSIWLIFPSLLPFILVSIVKTEHVWLKYCQLFVILLASTFSILVSYNMVYGSAFWIIFFLLAYKYRFLSKHLLLKTIVIFIYLLTIIQVSAYRDKSTYEGFGLIIFLVFFLLLLYGIFKAELDRVLFAELKLQKNISSLIDEKQKLGIQIEIDRVKLKQMELKISQYQSEKKPFDLDQCLLTPTETKIVRILVLTRATNREISEILEIKESTVKQHFYRIFNKMGVDERHQIIDLCRYNFPRSPMTNTQETL